MQRKRRRQGQDPIVVAVFCLLAAAAHWQPCSAEGTLSGSSLCHCLPGEAGQYGYSCAAHDLSRSAHAHCDGTDQQPDWCSEPWCYVDASACKLEYAQSEARPTLAYSYATCGLNTCPCLPMLDQPGHYGYACGAHDLGPNAHSDCKQMDQQPEWCSESWCYVDPSDCAADFSRSQEGNRTQAYSYATCGSRDHFSEMHAAMKAIKTDLRLHFLANSGGWKGNYCDVPGPASCDKENDAGPAGGPVHQMVRDILTPLNVGMDNVQPIHHYATRIGSVFDKCVNATGMGFLDICIGAFAMTPDRIKLSKFVEIEAEPVYLVTRVEKRSEDAWNRVWTSFSPFELSTWIAIFLTVVFVSTVLVFVERGHGGEFDGLTRSECLGIGAYLAFCSMIGGFSIFHPETRSGRIVSLALGGLAMLTIAAYTANLASFMVLREVTQVQLNTLDDVLSTNSKLCVHWVDKPHLIANTKFPESSMIIYRVRSDVFASVGVECEAAIMRREDYDAGLAEARSCEVQRIGDHLYTVKMGFPVSSRVHRAISFHMMDMQYKGVWNDALEKFKLEDPCAGDTEENSKRAVPISVFALSGPLVLTVLTAMTGLAIHIVARPPQLTRVARHSVMAVRSDSVDVSGLESPRSTRRTERVPSIVSSEAFDDMGSDAIADFLQQQRGELLSLVRRLAVESGGAKRAGDSSPERHRRLVVESGGAWPAGSTITEQARDLAVVPSKVAESDGAWPAGSTIMEQARDLAVVPSKVAWEAH